MSFTCTEEEKAYILNKAETGRYKCIACAHTRKKKNPTLRLTFESDHVLYHCHHCNFAGRINIYDSVDSYINRFLSERDQAKVVSIPTKLKEDQQLSEDMVAGFFIERGIDFEKLADTKDLICSGVKWFAGTQSELPAVGFIYGEPDSPTAIKWRAIGEKQFKQTGSANTFFNMSAIPENQTEIVIVEGECDVIALDSVGIKSISVPNGAPQKIQSNFMVDPSEDGKFSYIWSSKDFLDRFEKIIICVDQDKPGDCLAEELARRLDRSRCWRVKFPDDCKDAGDVLLKHGASVLRESVESAEPLPLVGIKTANDFTEQVEELYLHGYARGESTGFSTLDNFMSIQEGMIYTITGYPGHGKSTFVDNIMCNLAYRRGWKFAIASFENPPVTHCITLAEKIIGRPFYDGANPRMSKEQMRDAMDFMDAHFVFLDNEGLASVASVMERTASAIKRLGVRGLVIDPYSHLKMEYSDQEHINISKMLTELSAFARNNKVAIFFVAHPAKQYAVNGQLPICTGHSISGSMAWWSKSDHGLTVHRGDFGPEIHVWKSRWKWLGEVGMQNLDFNPVNGRFSDRKSKTDFFDDLGL